MKFFTLHYPLFSLSKVVRFLKNWTLPVAMVTGAMAYLLGRELPFSSETRQSIISVIETLQPLLLFVMLFVAFCKVSPKALKPRRWHLWLILTQVALFIVSCLVLWQYPDTGARLVLEGFLLSIICPTATACAVVTQKLGGDSATTTAYTILINLVVAVVAPLMLPLAHPHEGLTFLPAFLTIIKKVFPLLILPLLLAWFVRYCTPRLHHLILQTRDLAFYLSAVALSLAIAITVRALVHSDESLWHVAAIAGASLVACVFQFAFGKWVGSRYGFRLEGGQAMGQKNTIFIIWLGYTFLSPISATAGGFYSVWHNVVNSWQLYKKRTEGQKK
jgi:BASS family bile acid:Na+ symporter